MLYPGYHQNHLRPLGVKQTSATKQFFQVHTVETVLSQVLILRLSEPRPTLVKQLDQGR